MTLVPREDYPSVILRPIAGAASSNQNSTKFEIHWVLAAAASPPAPPPRPHSSLSLPPPPPFPFAVLGIELRA
jgi:hypothetical protein